MANELTRLQELMRRNQEGAQMGEDLGQEEIDNQMLAQQAADLDPSIPEPPQAPAPREMSPDFREALEKRDRLQKTGMMLSAFKDIIHGTTGAPVSKDVSQGLMKQGDQAVSDVKDQMSREAAAKKEARAQEQADMTRQLTKINIRGKEIDIGNQEANDNPKSPASVAAQDFVIELKQKAGEQLTPEAIASIKTKSATFLNERIPELNKFVQYQMQQKMVSLEKDKDRAFKSGQSQLDRENRLAVEKQKREQDLADAERKEKEKEARDAGKESAKQRESDLKERQKIAEENRKEVIKINTSLDKLRDVSMNIEKAKRLAIEYESKNRIGTGAIATVGGLTGKLSPPLENLNEIYQAVSLSAMSKMFEGMSKAVDSDAERAKFEASQPGIDNFHSTNLASLERQQEATDSLIKKLKAAKSDYTKKSTAKQIAKERTKEQAPMDENSSGPHGDVVERNGKTYKWNPDKNKYQLIGQ